MDQSKCFFENLKRILPLIFIGMALSVPAVNAAAKVRLVIYTMSEKGSPIQNVKVFLSDATGIEAYWEQTNVSGIIEKEIHNGFWYLFCDQFGIHMNLNVSSPLIVYLYRNETTRIEVIKEQNNTKDLPTEPQAPMGYGDVITKTPLPWLAAFSIPAMVVMIVWKTRVEKTKEGRGVK